MRLSAHSAIRQLQSRVLFCLGPDICCSPQHAFHTEGYALLAIIFLLCSQEQLHEAVAKGQTRQSTNRMKTCVGTDACRRSKAGPASRQLPRLTPLSKPPVMCPAALRARLGTRHPTARSVPRHTCRVPVQPRSARRAMRARNRQSPRGQRRTPMPLAAPGFLPWRPPAARRPPPGCRPCAPPAAC
jgi:hypothetical protein